MAIFGRNKKDSNNSDSNGSVGTGILDNNNANLDFGDSIIHEDLQQEVVEAIGQGSEDVKRVIVTTEDDEQIIFTIAGGIIKRVHSGKFNYGIDNRLNWVDYNVFNEDEIQAVIDIFDKHDYFDALIEVSERIDGDNALALIEIISETETERSLKTVSRVHDKKIVRIETDWVLDSDTDRIEAYSGFNLDPKDIDFTVKNIETIINDAYDLFDNGSHTILYANGDTDYETGETDIARYVLGAVQGSYNGETGDNGVSLSDIADYSDGFPVEQVLKEAYRLLEEERLSPFDPYSVVEQEPKPEPEPEIEPIPEPEVEEEFDLEEMNNGFNNVEEVPKEIIDEPYPALIEGGTSYLGGALVQYIDELVQREPLHQETIDEIQYATEYNTLFEQTVQGVENTMKYALGELERSVSIYEEFASLSNKTDTQNRSSNLHSAVYHLEVERNDINSTRLNALSTIYYTINDKVTQETQLRDLINETIINKIEGINNVRNTVFDVNNDNTDNDDAVYNRETVPTYYSIADELGITL